MIKSSLLIYIPKMVQEKIVSYSADGWVRQSFQECLANDTSWVVNETDSDPFHSLCGSITKNCVVALLQSYVLTVV